MHESFFHRTLLRFIRGAVRKFLFIQRGFERFGVELYVIEDVTGETLHSGKGVGKEAGKGVGEGLAEEEVFGKGVGVAKVSRRSD
jgi:hypothetical protein